MLDNEYNRLNESLKVVSSHLKQFGKEKKAIEFARNLDNIYRSPVTILVCGEFKRGKSTFVNALIGRSVCPTDTDICTAVVSIIRYGDKEKVIRSYGDFSNLKTEEISIDNLEDYTVGSAEDNGNTISLEIQLPLEELKKGLVIIDTPGVGGLDPRHAALTNYFLPQSDITLFMTDVNEPLTTTELSFYKNKVLAYSKQNAIVVNKSDLKDEQSVEDIRLDTLNKVSTFTQTPSELLNVISVSAADCIREEDGLGNFTKLRELINKKVSDYKKELMQGLRDDLSEQLQFLITPLQLQLNQIEKPDIDQIKELTLRKDTIDSQLKEISNQQSPFRKKLNEKIAEERETIIFNLNKGCLELQNETFNAIISNDNAKTDNGGQWVGQQLKANLEALASGITLELNNAFERISQYKEFDGLLNFSVPNYRDQIIVKSVDMSVPVHKRILSSTPGWGVAMISMCLLGTGPLGLIASLAAGGYVGIRNNIDTATNLQENKLRQTYQSQIQSEVQNLRTYIESRFNDFQREWINAITTRAEEFRESLKKSITEIQTIKQQINIAVNKKIMIENQLKPLEKIKSDIDELKF